MKNKIILILISTLFCQTPDYYGIRYAENSLNIDALDPVFGRKTTKQVRLGELFNARLWRWGPKLEKEPDLVISLPKPSGMGMDINAVYAELKPNLKWPDGTALTVDDIIFTLDLYRNGDSPFEKSIAQEIKCESIDGSITKFKLVQSSNLVKTNFFSDVLLSIPSIQILPKHLFAFPEIIKNSSYSKKPTGAGPFFIDEISIDGNKKEISLLRNEYHHFKKPIQMLSEVSVVTEPLGSKIIQGLQYDDESSYKDGAKYGYDLMVVPIASRAANSVLNLIPHLESETYVDNSWIGLGFNVEKGILQSVIFRRLMDKMLDNQAIIDHNYDIGEARTITGPFIQDFGIYKEELKDRVASNSEITAELIKDLNCEKKSDGFLYCLNTQTGESEQVSLRLIYKDNIASHGSSEDYALKEMIKRFEEFGITIISNKLDTKVYYEKLKDKKYWDLLYVQYYFDWRNIINPLFIENSPYNVTGYHNEVLNGFMNDYINASPGPLRIQAGENIHQQCYDNVPYLFLWHVEPRSWKRKIIRNMSITPSYYFTTIHDWEISPRD